jgi:hypothetical protein
MTCGERDDGLAMRIGQRSGTDQHCICPALGELCKCRLDLRAAGRVGDDKLESKCLRRFCYIDALDLGLLPTRHDEHGNSRRLERDLTEQF